MAKIFCLLLRNVLDSICQDQTDMSRSGLEPHLYYFQFIVNIKFLTDTHTHTGRLTTTD